MWYACVLLNTSPLPVYDVLLSFRLYDDAGQAIGGGTDMLPLLAPGEHVQRVPDRITKAASALVADLDKTRVLIAFTDAADRRWRRDYNGHLSERRPPRPGVRPEDAILLMTRGGGNRDNPAMMAMRPRP